MSISFLDGHMDTLHLPAFGRRRRYHSPAFKAEIVAACLQPGVSTTAIALVNQLNPNLVRLWIRQHQRAATEQEIVPAPALVPVSVTDSIEQSGAPTETYAACLSQ
ncbi:transposase, partial [Pseudomonas sp. MWU12-2323]|uniref:transposase n=1 Tax=Pseudomonas sp. MWU12-2323 TaxID=2651296 RepID=UPI00128C7D80